VWRVIKKQKVLSFSLYSAETFFFSDLKESKEERELEEGSRRRDSTRSLNQTAG